MLPSTRTASLCDGTANIPLDGAAQKPTPHACSSMGGSRPRRPSPPRHAPTAVAPRSNSLKLPLGWERG
uniref:Uncharacterized protein n=1 Tax=Arundo donax TaxID=35708 RepID=A0A0A8Y100_ARUDO